jgi:hypothetical protein
LNEDITTQCLLFSDFFDRPVVVKFDQRKASSDGGAVLLKSIDQRLGLTSALAACLQDQRQPGKVQHDIEEILTQRVMAIACGYQDANDAARLASDPIHKLLVGRDPLQGRDLASQPTLSRFENAPDRKQMFRMTEALADTVIERHRSRLCGRARRITIDLDPTEDPTHGEQQLSFFNGYYDTWCYLPMMGYLTFNDEREQFLFTAILRPGNATAGRGTVGILRRLIARLRQAFPGVVLRVRLDGGFATPEVFTFLEAQSRLEYVVNMGSNPVLQRLAEPALQIARRLAQKSGKTEHLYGEACYAAKTWEKQRRVIYKAEVVRHGERAPKDNPRFVVTNMKQSPQWLYEQVYCQRGDIENRVKELHYGLEIGRTSCTDFWANQFRVLMTAAAYVLLQQLRWHAARTDCECAQVSTLRLRLLKLGAYVVVSVRRIVIHLPQAFPYQDTFHCLAARLGARSG